jgi:histidine triad (HIT) family protein
MPPQQPMTPEQQEELRKKLEAMSPEELKEYQKQQCIFCHIASGKVAAKKIFENDKAIAVLDINPANPGHILLMPKEHYMIMPQMPDAEIASIFTLAKQLSNVVLKALDVRGTNIIVANGGAAGQKAQHFMLHIIPRKEGDNVNFTLPSNKFSDTELDRIAESIRKKLGELITIKEKPKTAEDILKAAQKKPAQIGMEKKPPNEVIDLEFEEETSKLENDNKQKDKREDNEKKTGKKDDKKTDEPKPTPKDEQDDDDDNDKGSDEINLDTIASMFK